MEAEKDEDISTYWQNKTTEYLPIALMMVKTNDGAYNYSNSVLTDHFKTL